MRIGAGSAVGAVLAACLAGAGLTGQEAEGIRAVRRAARAARGIREGSTEDTRRARNEALNRAYREGEPALKAEAPGDPVGRFQKILREEGLVTFVDFLEAETLPVRTVRDPESGREIPVMGALGSDLINPWLAAAGIVDGAPLEEQPMYDAATNALREHTDFALVGVVDPALSVEGVPEGLRENLRLAYRRLNPRNRFSGGFDHPLYYASIREAARKLFREDHPKAKLTMDRLVVPESKGGFGIASCLLCHGQNHSDVYKRLVGEAMHFENRVAEGLVRGAEALAASRDAGVFRAAAEIVLEGHRDRIDPQAVLRSLALNSPDNIDRLKPGYDDFVSELGRLGCLKCHAEGAAVAPEFRPGKHGAFVLHPSSYRKVENIKALSAVIDLQKVSESELLRKVSGKAKHRGQKELSVGEADLARLGEALGRWTGAFLSKGD